MRQRKHYTREFRRQVLEKAYQRGSRSVESIATEVNISTYTLRTWMRREKKRPESGRGRKPKRPGERTRAEKFELLMQSQGLDETQLSGFCREKGIFVHQLGVWREEFKEDGSAGLRKLNRELNEAKKALERELRRKEKALAEAAALLVLKKKYEGLWEDEDD